MLRPFAFGLMSLMLLAAPAPAQPQAQITLKGAIDFHAHQAPDSVPRAIDAIDEARLAKAMGMRGMVMKNHWEPTASLAYMVRKVVPGIEVFGGVTQDLAVGGINLEAVKHMADITGGWGRVVWLPTFDNDTPQKRARGIPYVPVSQDGHLLPGVLALIDYIVQHRQLVLETGHISPVEGLMVVHEAHARGVAHIVVTHAMSLGWTVPQMQEAARDGAYIEFVYAATLEARPRVTMAGYAAAISQIGPKSCILATDFGGVAAPGEPPRPLEPQALLDFMIALNKQGIAAADIDRMAKTNPALALGLEP